ncbi:unnamed protein product, partial [marine sediment metagenome]
LSSRGKRKQPTGIEYMAAKPERQEKKGDFCRR